MESEPSALTAHQGFLRVLFHEFSTPVASMRALAGRLARSPAMLTDQQRLEAARLIEDHARHLAAMLTAVRTVTQHLSLVNRQVDPVTVQLADLVSGAAAAAGVAHLAVDIAADVAEVVIDESSVRQIVTNLLENARRHGRPPIGLRAWRRRTALELAVTDHGPGITREIVTRMSNRAGPPPDGPHGLGLWVVTQLVALNGGAIRVKTRRGQTCVRVCLPLSAKPTRV